MSERDATTDDDGGDSGGGRDLRQAAVAAVVVLGLLSAAAMFPAQGTNSAGGGGSGSGSGGGGTGGVGQVPSGPGGVSGALGALNPGRRTGVGGALQSVGDVGGNLGALSNAVHFTVESDRASYWRTGAYGHYTGSGWEQLPDTPAGDALAGGETLVQRVRLRQPARALPAAWQPRSVSILNRTRADAYRTPRGAYRVDGRVPTGTTYRAISSVGLPDPSTLRAAGTDYPEDVAEYYTRLPAESTDRLREFTDELTSEADNPYDAARTVEVWLENAKRYSLNASHDTSEPVADQFVFEMEKGYCEYFATAMVAMLRTQDVPARYVVGYGPGRKNDSGGFTVRGTDAHAWVEVYFPEEGWVRFDPTPAASRRARERQNRSPAEIERRPIVSGSPGDTNPSVELPSIPGDGINGTPTVPEVAPERVPEPPYSISLNETPVPGKRVTAKVTKGGTPVEGAVVTFEGEVVGRTDRNGEVTARVPYVSDLTVEARLPEGVDPGEDSDDDTVRADLEPRDVDDGGSALAMGGGAPPAGGGVQSGSEGEDDSERTYEVTTDVSLSVEGTLAPGRSAVLVATIDGVPVRNAEVTFAGRALGRTDRRGRIPVTVDESARGSVPVTVERGAVSERTALELATMHVGLAPDTLIALPGQGATVKVTVGDTPVPDAPVTVDGELVGTTDESGTVRVTLPVENGVRIGAEGPVLSKTVTVRGLFLNLAVVVLLVIGALAGAVLALRRHGPDVGEGARSVRGALARFGAWLVAGLNGLAERGKDAVVVAGRWLHVALAGVIDAGRRLLARAAGVSYTALAVSALGMVRDAAVGIGRWVVGLPRRLVAFLAGVGSRSKTPDTATERGSRSGGESGRTESREMTIRAAWRWFVRTLGLAEPETKTPGEMRRRAVEMGFPERPVSRLTEAFRDVEYGGREPTDTLRERAADAVRRVRNESESGRDPPGTDRPPRGDD